MAIRLGWTRDQLLMALRLYMRLPFGKLHGKNPEIIELAAKIGRTPNALAMKACNFASIDPKLNRKGLSGSSKADNDIWQEFEGNPTLLALEAEEAADRFYVTNPADVFDWQPPRGATVKETLVKIRRLQGFFRAALLVSYGGECAVTGLAMPELLIASHIIPWCANESRRADPTNGLLLNALLDKAFDRGMIAFDDDMRVIVSKKLLNAATTADLDCSILKIEGCQLRMPTRFKPDVDALRQHRETIFIS